MYVEFQLPSGAAGQPAIFRIRTLKDQIAAWAEQYNVTYRTKAVKYTFRLSLDREEDYTLFQLSWTGRKEYCLVHPDGRRT
jgi:hypothetical protein